MVTYLSGIQPTGLPHLGNYFGAIRQHLALARTAGEHFYFIADYHALTSSRDPEQLRTNIREVAVTYMALGLDTERVALFRQRDVAEVTEIAWMLACVTGMGLLERAHSFKDKTAQGVKPNVGLFTYPTLMAADILAYDADYVPVGVDQVQHVEMTQDMAGYFNGHFGAVFHRPEWKLPEGAQAKVPGLDGRKMSKSYGNTLWIFESGKKLQKAIRRIATDSRPPAEPKEPDEMLLFDYLKLLAPAEEVATMAGLVRAGGAGAPGYGDIKKAVIAAFEEHFAAAREKREELLAHPEVVDAALARGAEVARSKARVVRDRALAACGLG